MKMESRRSASVWTCAFSGWCRMGRAGVVLSLLALGLTAFGEITTWCVATSGSDGANTGTNWASPFLTISNALAKAGGGDTILVSNGTYYIHAKITVTNGVRLMSANNDRGAILDAEGRGQWPILYVNSAGASVSGFTLTHGSYRDWNDGQAAGLTLAAGVVSNCTIQGCYGTYAGGAYVAGGLLKDCLIVANTNYSSNAGCIGGGLGVNGGTVANCTISNNATVAGGGVYMQAGIMTNCTITHTRGIAKEMHPGMGVRMDGGLIVSSRIVSNIDTWLCSKGGGVYMTGGGLRNCLVAGNGALDAGGIYMGSAAAKVENCTVAGNVVNGALAAGGIRLAAGTVANSVIYGNSSPFNVVKTGGSIDFSCAYPAVAGNNNIAGDPQFVNPAAGNYRLTVASPCRDIGANPDWAVGGTDLDGNARVFNMIADMGAYEAGTFAAGALSCDFTVSPAQTTGSGGLTVQFTAHVGGGNTAGLGYAWDIEDNGTTDYRVSAVSVEFANGFHNVRLIVTNGGGETASMAKKDCVRIYPQTVYASPNGLSRAPYDTWAKAATNLADAVAIAGVTGLVRRTVIVSNGTYRVLNVIVDTDMTVQGMGDQVVLDAEGRDPSRVMIVNAAGAFVSGLTLYNATENSGSDLAKGPGLWLRAGTVSNCTVRGCTTAYEYGTVHVESGLLTDCRIVNNAMQNPWSTAVGGLGVKGGTVARCLIATNLSTAFYTGVCRVEGGILSDCEIRDNPTPDWSPAGDGGGLYLSGGLVENTSISRNGQGTKTLRGGGVFASGGILRNCLVAGNAAKNAAGVCMINAATVESCTVVSNCATGGGESPNGLASGLLHLGGTVMNSIVHGNVTSGGQSNLVQGVSGAITYSCFDVAVAGAGNIAVDPGFKAAAADDYHLVKGSPCINAGLNLAWMRLSEATDHDGNRRIASGRVDMGAYESPSPGATLMVLR